MGGSYGEAGGVYKRWALCLMLCCAAQSAAAANLRFPGYTLADDAPRYRPVMMDEFEGEEIPREVSLLEEIADGETYARSATASRGPGRGTSQAAVPGTLDAGIGDEDALLSAASGGVGSAARKGMMDSEGPVSPVLRSKRDARTSGWGWLAREAERARVRRASALDLGDSAPGPVSLRFSRDLEDGLLMARPARGRSLRDGVDEDEDARGWRGLRPSEGSSDERIPLRSAADEFREIGDFGFRSSDPGEARAPDGSSRFGFETMRTSGNQGFGRPMSPGNDHLTRPGPSWRLESATTPALGGDSAFAPGGDADPRREQLGGSTRDRHPSLSVEM